LPGRIEFEPLLSGSYKAEDNVRWDSGPVKQCLHENLLLQGENMQVLSSMHILNNKESTLDAQKFHTYKKHNEASYMVYENGSN
jgi:hypothetical protein